MAHTDIQSCKFRNMFCMIICVPSAVERKTYLYLFIYGAYLKSHCASESHANPFTCFILCTFGDVTQHNYTQMDVSNNFWFRILCTNSLTCFDESIKFSISK